MYVVTGAAGFVGSNLVKTLNDRGHAEILAVDDLTTGDKFRNLADCTIADYMDRDEFYARLAENSLPAKPAAIFHQGACADTMESNGKYMMAANFTYSKAVFQYAVANGIPLVYASSASVYGTNTASEESPANEAPINVYAYSKLAFDQYVRRALGSVQSTVVGLRYFNVYGPREWHKGRMSSMASQIYKQLKTSGTVTLFAGTDGYGDGEQMRDFVHVSDCVKVNLFFAEQRDARGIVNVGTGAAVSFNDVANEAIKQLGTGSIAYRPFPESLIGKYQSFTEADLTQLRALGYSESFLSIQDGMAQSRHAWDTEPAAPAG